MTETKSKLRRCTDTLFGGIKMSWLKVIIFAVASAVVTTIFLTVPIFADTSFQEMGVSYEAWILFAIIIMTNCEKPLESALKTFVFFLISQPLIYLMQVPFSYMGWGLFGYYYFWFILTLCTFPMAFVGWYLKKRNWLSLLILSPMLVFLTIQGEGYFAKAIANFPSHIIAAIFCFAQIALYLYAFFDGAVKRLIGLVPVVASLAVILIFLNAVDVSVSTDLPDSPGFSSSAVIELGDSSYGEAQIVDAEDGYVNVHMTKYGKTTLTVKDGDKTYKYYVEAKSDNGVNLVEITEMK
ncbi:MAG: hypothetical protein IJT79_05815 [Ruminococcus sp.]|nr:hypothetical protein [Ruminococcus sp.]